MNNGETLVGGAERYRQYQEKEREVTAATTVQQTAKETPKPKDVVAYEPSKFSTLMYPLNMTPEDFFPECILFRPTKRVGLKLNQVVDAFKQNQHTMYSQLPGESLAKSRSRYEKTRLRALGKKATTTQKEEYDAKSKEIGLYANEDALDAIESRAVGGMTLLSEQIRDQTKLKLDGTTENTLGHIYLNMPNNIQFSEAANWESTSLGWVGAIKSASFGAAMTGGMLGQAGNVAAAGLGGAVGLIAKKLGLSSSNFLVGAMLGGLSQGSKIQSGLESVMSMAQNPYMEMMFQGVGFRKFSFNFIMRPRNEDEVISVMSIIKMFRLHSRPSWIQGVLGQSFMKYPMEFHIQFLTMDESGSKRGDKVGSSVVETYKQNPNIPQLKPCVCTGVETNYTPQSIWAAYEGGVPIAVNLGLTFNETELVMAEDVDTAF